MGHNVNSYVKLPEGNKGHPELLNIYRIIMSHPIGAEPWKSQPRQTKVGKPRQETQKKNTAISIVGWKKMENGQLGFLNCIWCLCL